MDSGDAFPCAYGSEAPVNIILNNDPKVRCPLCRHLAANHDPQIEGTCDICRSSRLIVNSLVDRLRAHGIDLTIEPAREAVAEQVCTSTDFCQAVTHTFDCPMGAPQHKDWPTEEHEGSTPQVPEPVLCNVTLNQDEVVYRCDQDSGHDGEHRSARFDGMVLRWGGQETDWPDEGQKIIGAALVDKGWDGPETDLEPEVLDSFGDPITDRCGSLHVSGARCVKTITRHGPRLHFGYRPADGHSTVWEDVVWDDSSTSAPADVATP